MLRIAGGFNEVFTVADPPIALDTLPKRNMNPNSGFILSPVEMTEEEKPEDDWMKWSGATYMQENIPSALGLRRITLHKHFLPLRFRYMLLAECDELLSNPDAAQQFLTGFREHTTRLAGAFKVAIPYKPAK